MGGRRNGIWCYGVVSRVYVKKGRKTQEYMIHYDNGESMKGVDEHLAPATNDSDSEYNSEEDRDNMDRDSDNASTDYEWDRLTWQTCTKKKTRF
jgi:hypothetical protein